MDTLRVIIGLILLAAGRKLFWFFVGAVGFVAGLSLAPLLLPRQSDLVVLLVALVIGVIGAFLAIFLQHLAIAVAGFLAGGYLALSFLRLVNWDGGAASWAAFLLGGILGAVLVAVLFDWALILISSLSGAVLVVNALQARPATLAFVYIALFLVGLVVQAVTMAREKSPVD